MASMFLLPRLLPAPSWLDLIVWTEKCWRRWGSGSHWQQPSWPILCRNCTEIWVCRPALCSHFFVPSKEISISSIGSITAQTEKGQTASPNTFYASLIGTNKLNRILIRIFFKYWTLVTVEQFVVVACSVSSLYIQGFVISLSLD